VKGRVKVILLILEKLCFLVFSKDTGTFNYWIL